MDEFNRDDTPRSHPGHVDRPQTPTRDDLKVPDLQTTTQWCGKCQADVTPRGKGTCPRCGRFLREHFVSRRHSVNLLRRQQILDALIEEYRPMSIMQRAWCEDLSAVREQLEHLKPGSTEWQRTIQVQQLLAESLEALRLPTQASADTLAGLSESQLIQKLDESIAQSTLMRDLLTRGQEQYYDGVEVFRTDAKSALPIEEEGFLPDDDDDTEIAATTPAPTHCPYCYGSLDLCAALRENDDAWLTRHSERADVLALRERQRAWRIRNGHETSDGRGIARDGSAALTSGRSSTSADDDAKLMLESLRRRRRGY